MPCVSARRWHGTECGFDALVIGTGGHPPRRLAKIGLLDARRVAAAKPLSEHLEDWKAGLGAKGNTAAHAATQYNRAKALTLDAGATTWPEITPAMVQERIEHLRTEASRKRKKAMGAKSANHYLSAVKTFCRWMVKQRRASDSPCECLEPVNEKSLRRDARHERRALTAGELRNLLTVTAEQIVGLCPDVPGGVTRLLRILRTAGFIRKLRWILRGTAISI